MRIAFLRLQRQPKKKLGVENVKSFDEFLERRFPESRRKAYYLMSIHEHLPPQARKELKEVGWTKGLELAKIARRDWQHFDCATWLHKAREMPKEEFKQEVERELTGQETEPWEIVYFKLYKSQIPVVEQAIETAALMLGSDKSRGYCLEMICADFLAGTNLENENPEVSYSRHYVLQVPPRRREQTFLHSRDRETVMNLSDRKAHSRSLSLTSTTVSATRCSIATAGDANLAARCPTLRSTTKFRSHSGDDSEENLITLCNP